MKNRKFFYDILRDRGSSKYSITKFLALIFSLFLISYLSFELFFVKNVVDHTLVAELLAIITGLVGLKNSWGVNKSKKSIDSIDENVFEPTIVDSKYDKRNDDEEGVF